MSKSAIKKLLREAECQCLLWQVSNAKNARSELAKWEAEYSALEVLL